MKEQVAEQQRAMEEAEERENYATINLNDDEENLRLITALDQPSLGGPGHVEGLLDQQDHKGVGVDVALSTGNEGEEQSEFPPLSLDSSLEMVFGPGATMLANELESNSDKRKELQISDTQVNSDNEVELVNVSTPSKDQRKKRVRKNINLGDINSIKGIKDNSAVSSEEENSGEATNEVKKPRLGGEGSETHEEDNIQTLENKNIIVEENTNHSEELAEEIVENKDHTEGREEEDNILKGEKNHTVPLEGLKEGDRIMQVLLDMHEDEDPG